MACRLNSTKPLSEPVMAYYQLRWKKLKLKSKHWSFLANNFEKFHLQNGGHFVLASTCQHLSDIDLIDFVSFFITPQPFGLEGYCRHGSGGRAGGCQTCGTHISITTWRIFSIRSSVEFSRPVVVHCHGHLPICPIWACPWAKNLSNFPQIGSRLCGTHISETAGWIYPI